MVHSSTCRAPAAVAVIVFVGCCIKRVEGRWLVVAGAVVVAIVFTVTVAGVIFAIVLVGVVVLARVRGHSHDRLHCRHCGCRICNHPCGSCLPHGSRGSREPSSSRSSSLAVVGVVFIIIFVEVRGLSSLWKLLSLQESGVIVIIIFTVTVASVIFAINFVGVVVLTEDVILTGVGGHSQQSRRRHNRLLHRCCGCCLHNRPCGSHHLHGSHRPCRSRRHHCNCSPRHTQLGAASAELPWLVGHAARRVCISSVPPVVVAVAVVVVVAGGGHSLELR